METVSAKNKNEVFPVTTFIEKLHYGSATNGSQNIIPAKRLIIIGDVHGSCKTLESLLATASFDRSRGDHLIFVGDLVNKGSDSPGVIDLAIKHGAKSVRGNHDNAVLLAAAKLKAERERKEAKVQDPDTNTSQPSKQATEPGIPAEAPKGRSVATAAKLSPSQLEWLESLPLIISITLSTPLAPFIENIIIVHAGLTPDIPLEHQDQYAVMHMRSLGSETTEANENFSPLEEDGTESWAIKWSAREKEKSKRSMVVFGHDAKRQLQETEYAIGLDSACVYGNALSALILEFHGDDVHSEIIQVGCQESQLAPTGVTIR